MVDRSRRAFFRGRPQRPQIENRPPWALPEEAFVDACSRCDDCLHACPTRIIVRGDGGYPTVDFSYGECTFCGDCNRACRSGALQPPAGNRPPWALRAVIAPQCLQFTGTECRVCGDFCEARAIRFRLATAGRSFAQVDLARCTGCGACVGVCPAGVVSMQVPVQAEAVA